MKKEIWKDIIPPKELEFYTGVYQISSLGNIRSVERVTKKDNFCKNGRHRVERLLSPQKNRHGYMGIYVSSLKKNLLIHRLIAQAFIPNPENKKYNNHFSKTVIQLDIETDKEIKEWPSAHEVKRVLGFCNKAISLCALGKGRRKTANGFKWKYKNNNNEKNITANIQ